MEAVVKKLRAAGASRALVVGLPEELADLAPAMAQAGVHVDDHPSGGYPFVMVFASTLARATELVGQTAGRVEGDGVFWLAYPKGASKRYSADYNRDSAWEILEPYGMRPVSQVALDEDWSALRFRKKEYVKS